MSNKIIDTEGTAIEEDVWWANCPICDKYYDYEGIFDGEEITECSCGCKFRIRKIYFEDGNYIN